MRAKPVLILAGCLVLSVLIVCVLFALRENKASRQYDFTRVFPSQVISEDAVINLGYSSYYLAGATADKIYFGNVMAPLHMIESNIDLTDTSHIKLHVEDSTLRFKSIQIRIDSPHFFIIEGTQPYLFRGKLDEWKAERFMSDGAYFSLAEPISPSSFVLRAQSAKTHEDLLGKETFDQVKLFPGLLEKQFDGVFCVDGMLHYNKELQKVVYLYYYRNQYVVMDTSLHLIYRGNTIDPISKAQIKPDSFSTNESKTYTMSAPPLLVNKRSCTHGNWLLVNSAVRAKNDEELLSDQNSVVDVYDLKNGRYQFSFYLNNNTGSKLSGIWLFNQKLYAMFGNYIECYSISGKFLEKL